MKVSFYTLGCKVNQYDTELMKEKFKNDGYEITDDFESCDIFVINTCTVTNVSDKKSRHMISKVKRQNNDVIIVVCGCFSQVYTDDVKKLKGVDIILGTANRKDILKYVNKFLKTKQKIIETSNFDDLSYEKISDFSEKTRAIIKIEDGCENFCSYCIIPYARGKIRSKPIDDIIKEATLLAENGYKEIVLTGIHVASYGKDLKDLSLIDVIEKVSQIDKIKRIRLGSLEVNIINENFISRLKKIQKFCPQFHLSLQSGCDSVLKRMNRHYTTNDYYNACNLIYENFDNVAITTDIIVGFPGETDEEFNISLDFASKIKFAKIHVFPYSPKSGTVAAKMENQIDKQTKDKRVNKLMECEKKLRHTFLDNQIGKTLSVGFETFENQRNIGFSKNYCHIIVEENKNLSNTIKDVKIIKRVNDFLVGKLI